MGATALSNELSRGVIEAKALVRQGARLVDVRTREEYRAGHLPGAINIPLHELGFRLSELRMGHPVVVYCRSGNRSAQAAELLRGAGHRPVDVGAMTNW